MAMAGELILMGFACFSTIDSSSSVNLVPVMEVEVHRQRRSLGVCTRKVRAPERGLSDYTEKIEYTGITLGIRSPGEE